MGWVKLDDAFLNNPKVMLAGLHGRALYIAGLCHSSIGLTDGFIPAEVVTKLAALADVYKPSAATRALLAAGLWEEVPGGFRVHDYLSYQPSRDQALAERQAARQRKASGRNPGELRANSRPESGVGSASPSRPVPETKSPGDVKSPARARGADGATPRPAPVQDDEPPPLRPGQQQCPLCPEVFPDNPSVRLHLDTSPRHKVHPEPAQVPRGPSNHRPVLDEPIPPAVLAELQAIAQRPTLTVADLPPDLAAAHERFLARERSQPPPPDSSA